MCGNNWANWTDDPWPSVDENYFAGIHKYSEDDTIYISWHTKVFTYPQYENRTPALSLFSTYDILILPKWPLHVYRR